MKKLEKIKKVEHAKSMSHVNQVQYPIAQYKAFPRPERNPGWAMPEIEALTELEMKSGLKKIMQKHSAIKRRKFLQNILMLWPVWLGSAIACFAPFLHEAIEPMGPWGMRVLFPLVALADYAGAHFSSALQTLPHFLLYAQFPIEGLLAALLLRRRVTLSAVAIQVFFFHFLGAIGLWPIGGGMARYTVL